VARREVYIGSFEDPGFSWGYEEEGSPPCRLSPFFPPAERGGYLPGPFEEVLLRIDDGSLEGELVDESTWVARATKEDLKRFIDHLYESHSWYLPGSPIPHLLESLKELEAFVDSLEPGKEYALVASA
jgi:hypothetical protein